MREAWSARSIWIWRRDRRVGGGRIDRLAPGDLGLEPGDLGLQRVGRGRLAAAELGPGLGRSSRISSWPAFTCWPVLTRIASTTPPSRLETVWSCELAITRPWPRTVRSSSVEAPPRR
jgi:hypothetical protein